MTKAEVFSALQGLTRYGGLVENAGVIDTNVAGDNQYRLTVRVIDGNRIQYQHLYFWVLDDDGPGEAAYFEYRDLNVDPGAGFIDLFGP